MIFIIPRINVKNNSAQNFFFKNNQDLSKLSLRVSDTGKKIIASVATIETTKADIAIINNNIIEIKTNLNIIKSK